MNIKPYFLFFLLLCACTREAEEKKIYNENLVLAETLVAMQDSLDSLENQLLDANRIEEEELAAASAFADAFTDSITFVFEEQCNVRCRDKNKERFHEVSIMDIHVKFHSIPEMDSIIITYDTVDVYLPGCYYFPCKCLGGLSPFSKICPLCILLGIFLF